MGRQPKYSTPEEAKEAQKKQMKAAEERYKLQRKEYRENVLFQQQQIISLLKKNIIKDKEFLLDIVKRIDDKITLEKVNKELDKGVKKANDEKTNDEKTNEITEDK
jgi:hypothetical protein